MLVFFLVSAIDMTLLFFLTAVIGGTFGIPLGLCGVLDGWQAYRFGSQGWGRS